MKTVIVASHNPVKLQAVRAGFTRMFPGETFDFQGMAAPSGVPDQPFSSLETLRGARNRAEGVRAAAPQADFWVGVEGGVEYASEELPVNNIEPRSNPSASGGWITANGEASRASSATSLAAYAWVVILSPEQEGKGRTGMFFLPARVTELVEQGKELGEADDIVFGRTNSKQASGAVGLLTGDLIDRAAFYEQAVVLALIPFKNPDLY